ncbi:VanZ family protein [Thalassoglobus polymorphus]|uniref:VanZ like family protein n=1 Tax=Thalassoglobus polymorphus TaxID=2527994 RepID=A0A517QNE8_9PLAN|nr:VanZ family protein [Thalassoglobus polymorphus]QDT33153.1 hypothetical protein Mal48_24060 [Thalassoglobus polymorphus]
MTTLADSRRSLSLPVRLVSRWGFRFVWLSYACFLFIMTHAPIPKQIASVTSGWDKPLHLGAYFGLAVLTAIVCLKPDPYRLSHRFIIPLLMVFAALDEILQGPVGRHPDFIDWCSDCLGIVLGMGAMQLAIWNLNNPKWLTGIPILNRFVPISMNSESSGFAR